MASFYLKLREESPNKYGECPIRLFITIHAKVSKVSTGYSVLPKHWDDAKQRIKGAHPNAVEWNTSLEQKVKEAKDNFAILDRNNSGATPAAVAGSLKRGETFKEVATIYAIQFKEQERIALYKKNMAAINVIDTHTPGIKIGEMGAEWIERFKASYKAKHNTVLSKIKFAFTVLNFAVAKKYFPYNPLAGIKKGEYRIPDRKRLTTKEIDLLWNYIPSGKWDKLAKLTALFSYYARGARRTDVLTMPKSALYYEDKKQRLRWAPNKTAASTGKVNDMPVSSRLAKIIELADNSTASIFGIIPDNPTPQQKHNAISIAGAMINQELRTIMQKCGIAKEISFHDIRRSFLKHAQDISKDIYATRGIAGHSNVNVTQTYVGEDQEAIDNLLVRIYGS